MPNRRCLRAEMRGILPWMVGRDIGPGKQSRSIPGVRALRHALCAPRPVPAIRNLPQRLKAPCYQLSHAGDKSPAYRPNAHRQGGGTRPALDGRPGVQPRRQWNPSIPVVGRDFSPCERSPSVPGVRALRHALCPPRPPLPMPGINPRPTAQMLIGRVEAVGHISRLSI